MQPSSTEAVYLGNEINYMKSLKDDYFYYDYLSDYQPEGVLINDLWQSDPDGNNPILLFNGNDASWYEDSNYIDYLSVESVGDYVYFGANVHGYNISDNWRGHTCYYGFYRIKKDGNDLELLYVVGTPECQE